MSRALPTAILSIAAMIAVAAPAAAESRVRVASGTQGPVAVVPQQARAAAQPAPRYRRFPVVADEPRFFTEQVYRSEVPAARVIVQDRGQRPIVPLSGNPVDPGTPVSRTPAGNVVIGPAPGVIVALPAMPVAPTPYAPPEFTMIGEPSRRHMGSPVRLTYGVKPPESFKTGPKVVWLDETGRETVDDMGGRIKRLR